MEDIYNPLENEYKKLESKYNDLIEKLNLSGKTVESFIHQKEECEKENGEIKNQMKIMKKEYDEMKKGLEKAQKV